MNKEEINSKMQKVMETSEQVRDYYLNKDISIKDKKEHLKIYEQVLQANKSIVNASIVEINVERFCK